MCIPRTYTYNPHMYLDPPPPGGVRGRKCAPRRQDLDWLHLTRFGCLESHLDGFWTFPQVRSAPEAVFC